jgi:hypothetical protein
MTNSDHSRPVERRKAQRRRSKVGASTPAIFVLLILLWMAVFCVGAFYLIHLLVREVT